MENSYLTEKLRNKIENAEEFHAADAQQFLSGYSEIWAENNEGFFAKIVAIINRQVSEIIQVTPELLPMVEDPHKLPSDAPARAIALRDRKWLGARAMMRAWRLEGKSQDKKLNVLLVFLRVRPENWNQYKELIPSPAEAKKEAELTIFYHCFIAYRDRISRARLSLNFRNWQAQIVYWRKNRYAQSSKVLTGSFTQEGRMMHIILAREGRNEVQINVCMTDTDRESKAPIQGAYVGMDFIKQTPIVGGIWIQRVEENCEHLDQVTYPMTVSAETAWSLKDTFKEITVGSTFPEKQKTWIEENAGCYELFHVADVKSATLSPCLQRSIFVVNTDFSAELYSITGFKYVGIVHFLHPLGVMMLRFSSPRDPEHCFQVVLEPRKSEEEKAYLWGVYSGIDAFRRPEAGRTVAHRVRGITDPGFGEFLGKHEELNEKIEITSDAFQELMEEHPHFYDFFGGNRDDFMESERLFEQHALMSVEDRVIRRLPIGSFDLYSQTDTREIRRYLLVVEPDGQARFEGEFKHKGFCNIRVRTGDCLEFVFYEQNGERSFNQMIFYIGNRDPQYIRSITGIMMALSDNAFPMAQKSVLIRREEEDQQVPLNSLPEKIQADSEAFKALNDRYMGLGDYLLAVGGPLKTPREINLGIDKHFPNES